MSDVLAPPRVRDLSPADSVFLADVVSGLSADPKTLPCMYLYDERGSELFEAICELPEYYPTRTELGILDRYVDEMAKAIGARALVVEYGSGSGRKTRVLLNHLTDPVAYVPIEISREALDSSVADLRRAYPRLEILPICTDYTAHVDLPRPARKAERTCVYFPGSTIGNFAPAEARAFLRRMADVAGKDGCVLIGVDLEKERERLEAAYDDAAGVTAEFNLNLLHRIRDELDVEIPIEAFRHRALYNEGEGRIEMHLVSERDLRVEVGEKTLSFEKGETIHTENSYKYTLERFAELADGAGLQVDRVWTDPEQLFSVQLLSPRA